VGATVVVVVVATDVVVVVTGVDAVGLAGAPPELLPQDATVTARKHGTKAERSNLICTVMSNPSSLFLPNQFADHARRYFAARDRDWPVEALRQ
jgi:hypothetical protein